tara:strand:+ start:1699 stop:2634 length:936 start_codon:yes stop_codon:yes gene_type:complete
MDSFLRKHVAQCAENASHLSLIGGKYYIPDTELDEFHNLYSTFYQECHLIEKVRYPSRFYADVDKITSSDLSELIKRLAKRNICGILCIRDADENDLFGLHLICTDVVENKNDSIDLCTQYLGTYADLSVYNTGLRMIGSSKKDNIKRIYYPRYEIANGRVNQIDSSITPEIVKRCSIHLKHSEGPIAFVPVQVPRSKTTTRREFPIKLNKEKQLNQINLSFVHPKYEDITISKKTNYENSIVLFTDTKFCQNISTEHTNNHVYFVINTKTKEIHQKCFCTHTRKELSCAEFKSKKRKIPSLSWYQIQMII